MIKRKNKKLNKQKCQDIFINTDQINIVLNIAFGDFEDLNRTTFPNKVLRDKAFDIDKDSKYN